MRLLVTAALHTYYLRRRQVRSFGMLTHSLLRKEK